nr:unnamed protein product [Spirometra erinaceieuropaei]
MPPTSREYELLRSKAKWRRQMVLDSAASRSNTFDKDGCDNFHAGNVEDDDIPRAFLTELPHSASRCFNSPRSQTSSSRSADETIIIRTPKETVRRTSRRSAKLVSWSNSVTAQPTVRSDEDGTENTGLLVSEDYSEVRAVRRRQRPEVVTGPLPRQSVSPMVRDRIRLMETAKRRIRQRTILICNRQAQQQQQQQGTAPPPQQSLQRGWTELNLLPFSMDVGKQSVVLNLPVVPYDSSTVGVNDVHSELRSRLSAGAVTCAYINLQW